MEKNKQSIVPVILQNDQNNRRTVEKSLPQKLVARLKSSQNEVQKLTTSQLRWLLEGLSINPKISIKPAVKGSIA